MGYYRQSCSPYDVQQNQGRKFDFESIKKQYEDTVPLRGKRKDQNIRPIHRRDRAWERMIKVSDTEYYITFDAYAHRYNHNKAITWSLNNGMEFMTIHTPRVMYGQNPSMALNPREFRSSSTFWFYNFNLPADFSMINFRSNKYVRYDNKYYTIEMGDIMFQRKQGEKVWQPLKLHREFKHTIDRTKTKELRETIKPFINYYDIMCELVETKWDWGNPIVKAIVGEDSHERDVKASQALALFKPTDDGVPDSWLRLVERYKHRLTRYGGEHQREKLPKAICSDLYYIVKPCKATEVPLGQLSHDRYKNWYR